jgi:hypothetical protein
MSLADFFIEHKVKIEHPDGTEKSNRLSSIFCEKLNSRFEACRVLKVFEYFDAPEITMDGYYIQVSNRDTALLESKFLDYLANNLPPNLEKLSYTTRFCTDISYGLFINAPPSLTDIEFSINCDVNPNFIKHAKILTFENFTVDECPVCPTHNHGVISGFADQLEKLHITRLYFTEDENLSKFLETLNNSDTFVKLTIEEAIDEKEVRTEEEIIDYISRMLPDKFGKY